MQNNKRTVHIMQFTKRLIFMSDVKSWNCTESSICSIDVVTQEDGRKERGNSVEGNNRSGENTTKEEEGNKNSRPEISSDALRSYGLINFETCWKPVRRREPQASGILPQIPSRRNAPHSCERVCKRVRQ